MAKDEPLPATFEQLHTDAISLFDKSKADIKALAITHKMAQKVGEEAVEVAIEAVKGDRKALATESADLIYRLLVLWADQDLSPEEVWPHVQKRLDAARKKAAK
jgi:phosphoribosyl-ATP pyrophosphohydrolase